MKLIDKLTLLKPYFIYNEITGKLIWSKKFSKFSNVKIGEDALYNNATMTISAIGYNLTYTLDANRVIICLD